MKGKCKEHMGILVFCSDCGFWLRCIWRLLWIHPVDSDRSDVRLRARGPDIVARSRCWFLLEAADILASQTFSFEASTVVSSLLDWWPRDGNYRVLDVLVFPAACHCPAHILSKFQCSVADFLSELHLCAEGFPTEQQKAHSGWNCLVINLFPPNSLQPVSLGNRCVNTPALSSLRWDNAEVLCCTIFLKD